MSRHSLILVTGPEGAGKTTVMSALLRQTPGAAKIDAEDVGQVNPFTFDREFLELLWNNVIAVINNFWASGYETVITGSLLPSDEHGSLQLFRDRLPEDMALYVVHLHAAKPVRDQRRIDRAKPSSREWRDRVDASYSADVGSLRDNAGEYRYITIDNGDQRIDQTVGLIMAAIPEIYASSTG